MLNEEKRIWGIHTQDDNLFLKNDVIAIGWSDMGDLGNIDANRDAFKEKYTQIYPDAKKGSIATGAGIAFVTKFRLVIMSYFLQRVIVK